MKNGGVYGVIELSAYIFILLYCIVIKNAINNNKKMCIINYIFLLSIKKKYYFYILY